MKEKLFFVSVFFFFNMFIGAYPSEKAEIIEKAIDKFKNVGSFYFTKKNNHRFFLSRRNKRRP
jgi:hypothetical protein